MESVLIDKMISYLTLVYLKGFWRTQGELCRQGDKLASMRSVGKDHLENYLETKILKKEN